MLYPSGSSCNSSLEILAGLKLKQGILEYLDSIFNPVSISREELQELPDDITLLNALARVLEDYWLNGDDDNS
jgi:hypothetical protein